MFNNQIIAGSSGQGGGFYPYSIDQSLRFNDNDSAYLNRTPASAGNLDAWTFSAWVKRSNIGIATTIFSAQSDVNNWMYIGFLSGDTLTWNQADAGSVTQTLTTSQVFRDVGSWYHIVCKYDSAQATAADRQEIYINGTKVTAFGTATRLGQNIDSRINRNIAHQIGRYIAASLYFDGYIAEVNFIDGTALDATSFGEEINNIWVPKAYDTADGAYGTNGFYLSFADSSAIGDDLSGNTNDWTANNLAASDVVPDSPTLNYSTWNPLRKGANFTTSEGNLKAVTNATVAQSIAGTFGMSSGKWYWEVRNEGGSLSYTGIVDDSHAVTIYIGASTTGSGYAYNTSGQKVGPTSGTAVAYGATYTTGDIIGIALDMDAGTLVFYKNGVSQGTAFTGITGTWFAATSGNGVAGKGGFANFGQDSTFAGATTAGGNADGNGFGDFKYSVPSGFLALCSANLPEPTISPNAAEQADDYFNTVIWSGDGTSSRGITGVGHAPDFVWIKTRNQNNEHSLFDSVRGVAKDLESNSTAAEQANNVNGYINSFDSDGFTVVDGSSGSALVNASGNTFVAWNWKAGGAAVSNTDGSITSQVSAAPDAGFSVVNYIGTGTDSSVGHGLSQQAPEMIIFKNRDGTQNWTTYVSSLGATKYLYLNTTAAAATYNHFQDTDPTSSVFYIEGTAAGSVNTTGNYFVAHCFHSVDGFSKVGSYVGNGSADGTFVFTGFRPAWVMVKRTNSTGSWNIADAVRSPDNEVDEQLQANLTNAESTTFDFDFTSNGFKARTTDGARNASGGNYIYLAFAEAPFKYANAR